MLPDLHFFKYNTPEYCAALQLRYEILRQPLGLQFTEEELLKDINDYHLGLFDHTGIIACLSLTPLTAEKIKMRQVAVAIKEQNMGRGKLLALEAEKFAVTNGYKIMCCHARKTAVPFYLKLGYRVDGEEFTEVHIPHYFMQKFLHE